MINTVVTRCVVLSRTNFGEADRILTVITPDHGKVRLMAKGVRKSTSKLAGGIELFSISHITFIKGKGDINTLISTRLIKHYRHIVKDIERTQFGYELLKLTNRVTEDNSGEEYFHLLTASLDSLDDNAISLDILQFWLYMQLLKLGGHSPNLRTEKGGVKLVSDKAYIFDIDDMYFVSSTSGHYKSPHIKLLRLAIGLDSPGKLGHVKDIDKALVADLELSRTMLAQFIKL